MTEHRQNYKQEFAEYTYSDDSKLSPSAVVLGDKIVCVKTQNAILFCDCIAFSFSDSMLRLCKGNI